MMRIGQYGGEPNYNNERVQNILARLGPFNYSPAPGHDNVRRKRMPQLTLENGAKYEGEWNEESNKRDG